MNKKLLIGAAAGCLTVAAIITKKRSSGPRPTVSARMRECMETMPADFPPRMMFDNVRATRANTERILELLENQPPEHEKTDATAPRGNQGVRAESIMETT